MRCSREVCVPEGLDPVTTCTEVMFPAPPDAGPRPDLGFVDGAVPDTGMINGNPDAGMVTQPDSGPDPCLNPPGAPPQGFGTLPSPTADDFNGVWARCPNDAWAVGAKGLVARWDGNTWNVVQSPTQATLLSVWGSGKDDVWMVGDMDKVLHWNGFQLQDSQINSPTRGKLNKVWGFNANDFFVVGNHKRVFRYRGSGFNNENVAVTGGGDLVGVWGANPDDVWVVGGEGGVSQNSSVAHYHGGQWEVITMDFRSAFSGVWGSAANDVWFSFYTSSRMMQWDGNAITQGISGSPLGVTYGVYMLATDLGYVYGQGGVGQWDGTQWALVQTGASALITSMYGSSSNDIWAVGLQGTLLHGP